ncbi:hypothetical protein J2T11_002713 [Paenarthrobacter nicotinovorans]|jgi:hypothetical protein|nr:hypothetical protein [Paenarthrobacter nicotinovorans]
MPALFNHTIIASRDAHRVRRVLEQRGVTYGP